MSELTPSIDNKPINSGDNLTPVIEDLDSERANKLPYESFSDSRTGNYHERNEDALLVLGKFFGLADGVGSGYKGDLAAATVLNYVARQTSVDYDENAIASALKQSDAEVKKVLKAEDPKARGAATFVGVWVNESGEFLYSNVGDSRIYKLDFDPNCYSCKQISTDHTYGNLGLKLPEGYRSTDPARMIGVGAVGDPKVQRMQLKPNDLVLLCSDGLSGFVSSEQIEDICSEFLLPTGQKYDQRRSVAATLVTLAKENGSHDDTSVIILKYDPDLLDSSSLLLSSDTVQSSIGAKSDFFSKMYWSRAATILMCVLIFVIASAIAIHFYEYLVDKDWITPISLPSLW